MNSYLCIWREGKKICLLNLAFSRGFYVDRGGRAAFRHSHGGALGARLITAAFGGGPELDGSIEGDGLVRCGGPAYFFQG